MVLLAGGTAVVLLRSGEGESRTEPAAREEASPPAREDAPPPPAVPFLRGSKPLTPEDLAPTKDPCPRAVEFLIACQGQDGLFRAERGAREGDAVPESGHDAALTGLAVLLLLDAADPTGDQRTARSSRLALDAIAGAARGDGALAEDLEGHALATWALAAGYAHTGTATWGARVDPAVKRLLQWAHEDGGWRAKSGGLDADLTVSMWALGALHEALTLTKTVPRGAEIERAIASAGEWAADSGDDQVRRLTAGGAAAWSLLCQAAGETTDPVVATAALRPASGSEAAFCDPLAILWGTVHHFLGGDVPAWKAWEAGAVLPALARQRLADPGAGSWDPGDDRSRRLGRAWTTAVEALSWLVIRIPYREPKAK